MDERSNLIAELQSDFNARAAYIQAKVGTLVPSQIRALRLKSDMPRQSDLADAAEMHQSQISMFETPGANPTMNTLSSIASALKVGLRIEFVPFSEMLDWENSFSQDRFKVTTIDDDIQFLHPTITPSHTIDVGWVTMDFLRALQDLPNRWPHLSSTSGSSTAASGIALTTSEIIDTRSAAAIHGDVHPSNIISEAEDASEARFLNVDRGFIVPTQLPGTERPAYV